MVPNVRASINATRILRVFPFVARGTLSAPPSSFYRFHIPRVQMGFRQLPENASISLFSLAIITLLGPKIDVHCSVCLTWPKTDERK